MINFVKFFVMLMFVVSLAACQAEEYTPINHHQSFVASVNILKPSVTFYNSAAEEFATWEFEKAYTGAELIQHDKLLLYGHQLDETDLYELSSGKKIETINTGIGTTNAYYDQEEEKFFLTNSKTNRITSYDHNGNKQNELKLGNYPMSMASHNGKLYVVNYKDTKLSVIDLKQFQIEDEWAIEKSSNGIMLVPEENTIWIGGHGAGSMPNQSVDVYDLATGEMLEEIETSVMPVGFARNQTEVFVINHGANEVTAVNLQGTTLWELEVAANPFAVEWFNNQIIVAGYDDHKLYFVKNRKIQKSIQTDEGPFQLLVREVENK